MKFSMRRYKFFLLAGVLMLGGCISVGPDYQGPPDISVPAAWSQHTGQSKRDAQQNLAQWWELLDDPVLTKLIKRADADNLDVLMALSRIDEAQARYGIAASQYYPALDSNMSAGRQKTSENATGFPSRTESYESIGASMGWELDLFGRIRRQNEAAQAGVDVFVEDHRAVLVALNAEIARTYIEVRTLQKRLNLARANVANQRETFDLVQARYKSELTSQLDVHQARQNLASSESMIPLLSAALKKSNNHLAILVGQAPGTLNEEMNDMQPIPAIPDELIVSIPRDVLRQRPDIRRAERDLALQTAQVGMAEADLYHRLSLGGNFGFSAFSGALLSSASNLWSFGPTLVWNIFDAGRIRNNIEIENAQVAQARTAYEKTVLNAFEDVEGSLIDYGEELNRLRFLQESVDAAQHTVKIAKSQYKNGLTSFQTVLDAERVLFAEEDRLADSQGAIVRYFVGIYRAMGGGWNADQAITPETKGRVK